jgi:diacylglycerol kinase (ATP)
MPTAAIVFNPTKVERSDLSTVVDPAAAQAGWSESVWIETAADDPGTGMARRAIELGCDVVLAVGGDGTIRAVAEGLRGTRVPMALCPQGTGNLLAQNLELTLDNLEESVAAAFHGVDRAIDLGVARWVRPGGAQEERCFVVMAGLGLDAQIMSSTDEELKKKVGILAYVKAGVEALWEHRQMRLIYQLDDDQPHKAKVHTVIIGNCGSLNNNILLLPDAAVDDGVIDVVAMQPQGRAGWVRVAWKVLVDNAILRRVKSRFVRWNRDRDRLLNYQQCKRVELQLRDPDEIELDGDHFGEIFTVRICVEPKNLVVKMPPGWSPEDTTGANA